MVDDIYLKNSLEPQLSCGKKASRHLVPTFREYSLNPAWCVDRIGPKTTCFARDHAIYNEYLLWDGTWWHQTFFCV